MANATRRRAALKALSHVVGNKRGVNMHSYSDAKMIDFFKNVLFTRFKLMKICQRLRSCFFFNIFIRCESLQC